GRSGRGRSGGRCSRNARGAFPKRRPVRAVDHETGTGSTRSGRTERPASRGAGGRCGGALRGGPETACRSRRAGTKSALGEPRAVPHEVGGGDAEVAAPVDQRLERATAGERLG